MTIEKMLRSQMRFWAKQWRILKDSDSHFAQTVLSVAVMRRDEAKKFLPASGR